MKSRTPWNTKADDQARRKAPGAEGPSGNALNEWLRAAIADYAAEAGPPPPPRAAHTETTAHQDAHTAAGAVARLVRRVKTMDAGSRATIPGLDSRLREIKAGLLAAGAESKSIRSFAALRQVTAMVDQLAGELDDTDHEARSSVEGLRDAGRARRMDSAVADTIRDLNQRIEALSERMQAPTPPRRSGDVEDLRQRVDALLAPRAKPSRRSSSAEQFDTTLRALEARIEGAKARVERRDEGPASRDDEDRVRRIEAQLADIAERLRFEEPAAAEDDLSSAIAEIASRQSMLDERIENAGRSAAGPSDDTFDSLRGDIDRLDEHLAAIIRAHAEEEESRRSLADRMDAFAEEAPREHDILHDIRHQIEALMVTTEGQAREATVLDRFDDVLHRLPERDRLDALGDEIAALRQSLADDDSPRAVSRLEMQVAELARTIENSLATRQSTSDIAAVGMAASLADIRGALDDLAAGIGARPDMVAMGEIAVSLADIRDAIEGLAAERGGGADNAAVIALSADVAGIRETLDQRMAEGRAREEQSTDRLESRLNDIAAALAEGPASDVIDGLQHRLESLVNGVEALARQAVEPAALEELKGEIAAIRNEIADHEPPRLDDLESQIQELATRLGTAARPDADSGQLEELEARIADLAAELERATPRTAVLQRVEEKLMRLQSGLSEDRQESAEAAREAARQAVREFSADDRDDDLLQSLRKDLDRVNAVVGETDKRRDETVELLQGTLAAVVDRLSRLESDEREAVSLPEPAVALATGTYGPEPTIPRAPLTVAPPQDSRVEAKAPAADTETRETKLDLAALRELAGSTADSPRKPVDRRADFIAAARRAAEAAVSEVEAQAEPNATAQRASPFARIGQAIRNRRKPLLLAAAAIVLAIGAIQVFGPRSDELGSYAENEPEVIVVQPQEPVAAAPSADTMSPNLSIEPTSALVAPPPDARTAMELASIDGLGDRFASAFNGRAMGGARAASATVVIPPDTRLPEVGSAKLRAAAAAGDAVAAFEVANRLAEGYEAEQDWDAAVDWYRRAAAADLAVAQYRLASLYERGQGVEKDLAQAMKWYRSAANQGNVGAMHNLAVLISEGAAGEADPSRALEWFLAAANYGVKDSQYNLGVIYARGLGQAPDLAASYKWFAIAAAAGDADAAARRDEVASMFDPDQLASARATVKAWHAKPPVASANSVKSPPGGWDQDGGGVTASDQKALVMKIQALLVENGYDPGPADGVQGPKTREAVRAFQEEIGVAATGVIDPALVTALSERKAG